MIQRGNSQGRLHLDLPVLSLQLTHGLLQALAEWAGTDKIPHTRSWTR